MGVVGGEWMTWRAVIVFCSSLRSSVNGYWECGVVARLCGTLARLQSLGEMRVVSGR